MFVIVLLLVGCGSIGAAIGFLTVSIRAAASAILRRQAVFTPRQRLVTLVGICMPPVYVAMSCLIEKIAFAQAPTFSRLWVPLLGAGLLSAFVAGIAWTARRYPFLRWTPALLLGGVIVGASVLPFRVNTVRPRIATTTSTIMTGRPRAPLLLIGLDGGTWRALRPLIDRGALPTFSALLQSGVSGTVPALWPPYWSTPAWGAILTGHSQEEIGVHEDLSATAPGLPTFELPLTLDVALDPLFGLEYGLIGLGGIHPIPTPRSSLRAVPIWSILSGAGVKTAVVRFPFTFPATGQSDIVVSNRVIVDLWDMLGMKQGPRSALVFPATLTDDVLARFQDPHAPPALLAKVLPPGTAGTPRGAVVNPTEVLDKVLQIDAQMMRLTADIIKSKEHPSAVMLHVTAFDSICHAFWPYRFPEDFADEPPDSESVRHLGPVMDNYLVLLDGNLKMLIESFDEPPNVVIVSDHGEARNFTSSLWPGWHASPGMFLAAGPDIARKPGTLDVSYYDIVPTLLSLEGLTSVHPLLGRSVVGVAATQNTTTGSN
jgi:hypothetical protein